MTGAAEALSFTPSAVSQQIRKLEAQVRQPLLDRHARGVALTDAGKAVVEHVELIQRQLSALQGRLDDIACRRAGSLRIGTFPTVSYSLLPSVVTRFKDQSPGIELLVHSSRLDGLMRQLEARALDAAFLWDYPWCRIESTAISYDHLIDDPTMLLVSKSHPMAGRKSVHMAELRDEKWITRADLRSVVEVLQRSGMQSGFQPMVSYEAHDYQETQAMVAVGLGIALVPKLGLANLRTDLVALELGTDAPSRRILIARPASKVQTPADSAFTEALKVAIHAHWISWVV